MRHLVEIIKYGTPQKFQMAITLQRVNQSSSCLVAGGVFGDGTSNGPFPVGPNLRWGRGPS